MVVNEIGAALIGLVFGWLLARTVRKEGMDWKQFGAVAALIVGGSGLDYVFKSNLVGYFWIGIAAGFFGNLIIRFAFRDKPGIEDLVMYRRSSIPP